MKIWERQKDESDKAFGVFKMYLEMEERTLAKVAEMSRRDVSLIRKWAAKHNWRERAIAWDNQLLEDKRKIYAKRYFKFLDKQFKGNEKIQDRALKVFEENDMSKISWKSLNEIYRANFTEMVEIADKLGISAAENDSTITINIQKAEKINDSEQRS